MKKSSQIIILIISFGIFCYTIFEVWQIYRFQQYEMLGGVKNIPPSYLSAFRPDISNFSNGSTVIRKSRTTISSFVYDNKYGIFVYSLDLLEDKPLNKIVKIGKPVNEVGNSPNIFYSGVSNSGIGSFVVFNYALSEPSKAINGLDVIIEKDKIIDRLIENDSIICYHFPNSSGFKLKYVGDSYSDVVFKMEPNQNINFNGKANIGLIIKKQNKKLVIASVSKKNNVVPELSENVLLDLVNGDK
ncbi:hypothetical protein [Sphingobacterium spiritivorum]|uniref:hypothetical protein n=1 Tax=Sphingobacterium spiritivorum TaxID=258 RepID=UPI001918A753|nr:hypothetical protein [Sphingobacterium spiritivorum]QQT26298.1 hypothetical protein I6J02_00125 [Sphingobacterium spiritivorum]